MDWPLGLGVDASEHAASKAFAKDVVNDDSELGLDDLGFRADGSSRCGLHVTVTQWTGRRQPPASLWSSSAHPCVRLACAAVASLHLSWGRQQQDRRPPPVAAPPPR